MPNAPQPPEFPSLTPDDVLRGFESLGYVGDRALATSIYLAINMHKPLLIEGHAGLGKTEAAKTLAAMLGTVLIRLQCYEGLDVSSSIYEWNYQKQLSAIKLQEGASQTVEEKEKHIFSREFLLERPLLRAIVAEHAPPVLLIDEVDRADEAFEAFLLELLSDKPVSGKSGDKAIISADGTIWGWIGGGCAQPAVVSEALKALKDGRPRLVRISPSSSQEEGVVAYNMTCHSGGALEVYIEPVLPKPHIPHPRPVPRGPRACQAGKGHQLHRQRRGARRGSRHISRSRPGPRRSALVRTNHVAPNLCCRLHPGRG